MQFLRVYDVDRFRLKENEGQMRIADVRKFVFDRYTALSFCNASTVHVN